MSQRSSDEERGEPASEISLTRMTPTAPEPVTGSSGPARPTPNVDMTSPHDPGSRDNGVHEELARIKQENAQLHEALRSRTVLGQATGLLMATLHLSPDEAFAALVKMSSYRNRKVRDVAAGVVAGANASRAREMAHPVALPELLLLLPETWPDRPRPGVRRNMAVRPGEDTP
jgi:ANTAR domain